MLRNDPEFKRVRTLLEQERVTPAERVAAIKSVEQMHTFAGIINRTRRRDIGEFTVRKPETVTVDFNQEQRALHDSLLEVQAGILARLHGDQNVKFMMTTLRRQAASCLFGLAPLVRDILSRGIDELSWDEADDSYQPEFAGALDNLTSDVADVMRRAEALAPDDPKLEALQKIVTDKQRMPNNKIMVFSSFLHTLGYLFAQLSEAGVRVGLVYGKTPDEERVLLRGRFQLPREANDALDVLLFSEVGCEGLDYQFCDCMVNYDLPWNPMRIEQRIGRIDRNGQRSESVAIYNLITPDTVDADIYERCLVRIGVFNASLGGSEEILGRITREIKDVAENYMLTSKERQAQLQQIADNEVRLIQEQQTLEEQQVELFGIRLPNEQMQADVDDATSFWLSPLALEALAVQYLESSFGGGQEYLMGEKSVKTLRLSQETRSRLLEGLRALGRKSAAGHREWEAYLRGGNPHLAVTFDSTTAADDPSLTFITPLHPLVRQGARALEPTREMATSMAVTDDRVHPGTYTFAVYQWQLRGIREDLMLRAVSDSAAVEQRLFELLARSKALQVGPNDTPSPEVRKHLDERHYAAWFQRREAHREDTRRLVAFRRQSLVTSHAARMAFLQEQLIRTADQKIRRMRESQTISATADYGRHIQELELAEEKADITAQVVGYGVLKVLAPKG